MCKEFTRTVAGTGCMRQFECVADKKYNSSKRR